MSLPASLSQAEAEALFGRMLDGNMAEGEIEEVLVTLADRGETVEEIAGAASAMRARMVPIAGPDNAIDVCGTGGDGQHTLNVSTAVSLVVAACEVPVAKHGNRAASSKSGAADTLEALGLDLTKAGEMAERTLSDIGICFLFAQAHHPAMRHVMPIRKALGRRTIFNLLGPLCNPAGVTKQLVGVARPAIVPTYRAVMELLGSECAMVVSGMEGLDEISIAGETRIECIGLPEMGETITPDIAGFVSQPLEGLRGGDAEYNARKLYALLQGETGPYRDAVLFNAAGALMVAGEAENWSQGVEEAAEALDKGLAKAMLDCWVDACK